MSFVLRGAMAVAIVIVSIVGPVCAATIGPVTVGAVSLSPTITGRITDSTGTAVSGATVTATGAGTRLSAITAGDGTYSIAAPPGVYSISVVKGGFQSAGNDGITVATGTPIQVNVSLSEQNLQSLRTIGRTSATGNGTNRTPFNVSEAPVSQLPQQEISLRQNNNLTDLVANIPGVTATRTFSSTPNTNFAVRGLPLQTRVTIDGHPVSSGIVGEYNTNYAASYIFQDAEVVKGAGLNGAIAGESAVGTVNLRTADFAPKNRFDFTGGGDNYTGSFYNFLADVNFGADNKFSLILQKSYIGYRGPWDNYYGDRINTGNLSAAPIGTLTPPNLTGLEQWQGDYSNRYSLEAQLAKLRYKFNESSSITVEFLGLQGQYQPQGGSYGSYLGNVAVQSCQTTAGAFITYANQCPANATFSAPYTFANAGTTVPGYSWFPNSFIQNNEPQFSAELRTSIGSDTALFRPYTHVINRYISGVAENQYPGNGGGWNAVTNIANCQVQYLKPGTTGIVGGTGAAGPCFPNNVSATSSSYVGANPTLTTVFNTTANAPNGGVCSTVAPFTCFTNPTAVQNDGRYGYSTPFSQPEFDQLFGYTFTYIHPVANNTYFFSYDYRRDYTQSSSSDGSGAAPGCQFVIGSISGSSVYGNGGVPYQPGCSTAQYPASSPYAQYNKLPRSAVGTPPTLSQYADLSLNGLFQLTPALRLAVGNYFEIYRVAAQIENPVVLNGYAALGNSAASPVSLITQNVQYDHYDPHIGFEYRVDPTTSVRVSGGSSITQPYAGILSGFGSVTIPNAANGNIYTVNIPNSQLRPETSVAYDVGFDKRLGDGGVISMDAYHINVHNVFLSLTQTIATPPQFAGDLAQQTNYVNGPEELSYGLEFQIAKAPTVGFGYYANATLNRTYYNELPLSLYAANTKPTNVNYNINGVQIFGIPFWKGYAQGSYNWRNGATFLLGLELQGQDNSTYGPPYAQLNAAYKLPIVANKIALLFSGQNLNNTGNGATQLGRVLSGQGFVEPGVYLNNGVLTYAGPNGSTSTPLQALPPRTFRFSLNITP